MISFNPSTINAKASGGTYTIVATSTDNGAISRGWTYTKQGTDDGNFCSIEIENPLDQSTNIFITVDSNPTTNQRLADITFDFNGESNMFSLYQDAKDPQTYSVTPSSDVIDGDGGSVSFTLTSSENATWSVSHSSGANFATYNITGNGTKSATLTFTSSMNLTSSDRYSYYKVSSGEFSKTITVGQYRGEPTYSVTPTTISAPANGGTYSINCKTNYTATWSVSESADWITTSVTGSPSSNATVSVVVAKNTTGASRSAELTLSVYEGYSTTVTVTQEANQTWSVSPSSGYIDGTGGSVSFTLSSNFATSWSYAITNSASWATVTLSNNGTKGVTAKVTAASNPYYEGRFAYIKFSCDGYEKTIAVNQGQGSPVLSVSPASISASSDGGTYDITCNANYLASWSATESLSWCSCNVLNNGNSVVTIRVTVNANTTGQSRSGNITITNADTGVDYSRTVSITQAANHTASISDTSAYIEGSGGSKSITLTSNYNTTWTATPNSTYDWLNISISNNGTKSASLNFSAGANPYNEGRFAYVKVSCAVYEATIVVNQGDGVPVLSVTPLSTTAVADGGTYDFTATANYLATFGCSTSSDWFSYQILNNGSSKATIRVTVNKNTSGQDKTGTLSVYTLDESSSDWSEEVTIKQMANHTASISKIGAYVEGAGGSDTVHLTSNYNTTWTAAKTGTYDWFTFSLSNNGTKDVSLVVSANANPYNEGRFGYIRVKCDVFDQVITVNQGSGTPVLSVSPLNLTSNYSGETKTITCNANYLATWSTTSPDWCTCTINNNGSSSVSISVKVAENKTGEVRTGSILVWTADSVDYSQTVTVTQDANPTFDINPDSGYINGSGGSAVFNLITNYDTTWSAEITNNANWLTLNMANNGGKNAVLTASAEANPYNEGRFAYIKIYCNGFDQTVVVNQGDGTVVINVDPTSIAAEASGGTFDITCDANYLATYGVSSNYDWCSWEIINNNSSLSTVRLTIAANESEQERSGSITIYTADSEDFSIDIPISQKAKHIARVSKIGANIAGTGGSDTILLTSNYDTAWTAVKTDQYDWFNFDLVNNNSKSVELVVSGEANPFFEARVGYITVKCDVLEQTLTVYQSDGTYIIKIDKTSVELPKEGGSVDVLIDPNYRGTFECSASEDWISCELLNNGSSEVTLRISAPLNELTVRTGSVTVNCVDVDVNWSATVEVMQMGEQESWLVTPSHILTNYFAYWGAPHIITATSNYPTDWTMSDLSFFLVNESDVEITTTKVDEFTTTFRFDIFELAYDADDGEQDINQDSYPNGEINFNITDTKGHTQACSIEFSHILPTISETEVVFDGNGGTKEITLTSIGAGWDLSSIGRTDWLKSKLSEPTSVNPNETNTQTLTLICESNYYTNRTATVEVSVGLRASLIPITITQLRKEPDSKPNAICEPRIIELSTDKSEYHLYKESDLLYTGMVYKYPDASKLSFELNDVLSNYLSNNILLKEGSGIMPNFMNLFWVETDAGYQNMFYTYNSWEKPTRAILNDPISNLVDSRQFVFVNYLDTTGTMKLYKDDSNNVVSSNSVNGYYYSTQEFRPCGRKMSFKLTSDDKQINSIEYVYGDGSKDYVLYYVNAYGGWDSLLINGNVKRTDNFTSYSYRNKQNGKVKYMNEITPSWSLYTDDMNDGSKMYHLLESTEVYLHNLKTDEIIPVVISDSSCEYKTYANQGNTRFYYVINVEASKYKYRK